MARPRLFQVPAVLEGISPLKDGGMSIRFHTQEVKPKDQTKLLAFYQKFGWVQFSDHTLSAIPKEAPIREAGVKTPSQRLRATLFVYWQQSGHTDEPFDEYYTKQMERIIDSIKMKLM